MKGYKVVTAARRSCPGTMCSIEYPVGKIVTGGSFGIFGFLERTDAERYCRLDLKSRVESVEGPLIIEIEPMGHPWIIKVCPAEYIAPKHLELLRENPSVYESLTPREMRDMTFPGCYARRLVDGELLNFWICAEGTVTWPAVRVLI